MKIGIIGGGLTGLTLSYFLKKDYQIFEKESECGGLCRTFNKDGFFYDIGGHILFSRNNNILEKMISILGTNVHKRRRNNKIWFNGRFVKYPFENSLYKLSKKDIFECLYYYLKNDYTKPRNFKEWIYYTFGKGIAEKYLIPYNEKIWKYDLQSISLHWVDGRIPKPPMKEVLKSAIGIKTEGYKHQLDFYYPKKGGIQSLISALKKEENKIIMNYEVKEIKYNGYNWIISNGEKTYEFDRVVSTIPLQELLKIIKDVPRSIKSAVNGLKFNSLIVCLIGLNKSYIGNKTAIYFSDKRYLFHRICFNNNFSKNLVPEGKSSIIAEITYHEGDELSKMEDDRILNHVIKSLEYFKIIRSKDICETDVKRIKYAYVIYDLKYLSNIKMIYKYFKKKGIILCGRFSEFKYLNMDDCFRSAMDLANKLNAE